VHDLVVKDNDLVVGTHGRSIWIFDDLTPIREYAATAASTAPARTGPRLFPVQDTIAWRYSGGPREKMAGQNPPRGAIISYYLHEKPKGEVKIEIFDAQNRLVRTLSSKARELTGRQEDEDEAKPELEVDPGIQRGVWTLQWEGARLVKGAKIDYGDPTDGPAVVPGTYTIKLTVDGREDTSKVNVRLDPRVKVSQAELEAEQAFALQVRDAISRLTGDVVRLKAVREQLQNHVEVLEGDPRANELIGMSRSLIERLDKLEARMHNPEAEVVYDILARKGGARLYSRLSPLMAFVNEGDGPPTQGMKDVFAQQQKELTELEGELKGLVERDLATIQLAAKRIDVPFVVVRP
jgi:hypothetical protein